MRLKFAIPVAFAAASLSLAGTSQAVVYTESPDAGDLPGTAQTVPGVAGTTYNEIDGALTFTNGLSDSDMFQITIAAPSTFTASTTAFAAGANNFDTQVALFTSTGLGISANDDAASGGSQSKLTASLATGSYYLLISGSGRYPVDSTGKLIFANYTDGTTDPSATVTPNAGTGAIAGYTGNSNEGGNYHLALTVVPAAVPEPSTWAFVLAGVSGLALATRARRSNAA